VNAVGKEWDEAGKGECAARNCVRAIVIRVRDDNSVFTRVAFFHFRDLRNVVGSRLCNYIFEQAVKELGAVLDRELRVRSELKER
jgi:hypothetical protein